MDKLRVALERREKARVGQILPARDERTLVAGLQAPIGGCHADSRPYRVVIPPPRALPVDAHAHRQPVKLRQAFPSRLARQAHGATDQAQHARLGRRGHGPPDDELRGVPPSLEGAFKTEEERVAPGHFAASSGVPAAVTLSMIPWTNRPKSPNSLDPTTDCSRSRSFASLSIQVRRWRRFGENQKRSASMP